MRHSTGSQWSCVSVVVFITVLECCILFCVYYSTLLFVPSFNITKYSGYLAVFFTWCCVTVQRIYSASAIPLKWLYAKQKSPVYSHFEETICGTATVRAYRKQKEFMETCDRLTDISHQPWHQYLVCWR